MGFLGCFKKQPASQRKTKLEPQFKVEPTDYAKLANRNTSYLIAEFMLTNVSDYVSTEKLTLSGTPLDMQKEYQEMKNNTMKYLKKYYPRHNLFKVISINLYTSADADLKNYSTPLVASPPLNS